MARRAWWPTVETSEATLFARGIVAPAACGPAGADCCDPPAAQSGCCPDGFESVLLFSALGPLGANFGTVLLEYELNRDAERGSWIGGTEGPNGEALAFETYCIEDDEFGTLWVVTGSYYAVALGVYLPFFVWGTLPFDGTIVAEVEVPGSDTPLTIAISHPCPTEANGGGSPGSGGGGTDPGGVIEACGCTGISGTLYVTFSGALAGYGTQVLTYVNSFIGWTVTPGPNGCNGGTSPISFNCQTGTTWILSSPGSGNPVTTSFSATASATTCSPLLVSFSGTATGNCAGAWAADVSEIAP